MTIIYHLEKHLGKVSDIFKTDTFPYDVSIFIFRDMPAKGLVTYSTVGVSYHCLNNRHYEFVFCCGNDVSESEVAGFLYNMAFKFIHYNVGVLRGQVFEYNSSFSSNMTYVYISTPFYYDDDFQVCQDEKINVIFPLLIPIYKNEANFIRDFGWKKFENYLIENQKDNLYDVYRNPYFHLDYSIGQ